MRCGRRPKRVAALQSEPSQNCSSGDTRFGVLIGSPRNHHHISFGKHLSRLGGEEHGVVLLFALRTDEPWPLNRSMVAVMLHLPRENLHICVLHLSNAITQSVQKGDGFVVFAELLNDILYARRFRLDQLFEFLTHTPHKLCPIVSPVELANHITPPPLPPNPNPPGCHSRFTIDVSHMRRRYDTRRRVFSISPALRPACD